jgi:hypothetical protein
MSFTDAFAGPIKRNAELAEQAKKKAKALDDGTHIGRLKAKLILALDDVRTKRSLVALWALFAEKENGSFYEEQHALAEVDLREAKEAAAEVEAELGELGIEVKIVRRKDYRIEGE